MIKTEQMGQYEGRCRETEAANQTQDDDSRQVSSSDKTDTALSHFGSESSETELSTDYSLPRISNDQVQIGKLLGNGAFFRVHEVKNKLSFDTNPQHQTNGSRPKKENQFVIKRMRTNASNTPASLATIMTDLKNEGQILASLNHRNDVVSIFAWTFDEEHQDWNDNTKVSQQPISLATIQPDANFLLLERLDETLKDKLKVWRDHLGFYQSTRKPVIGKRCKILLDLAEALRYIHSRKIIHRDLKPGNIGFQKNDCLKLFDFGVSRILPAAAEHNDKTFQLTGLVGTFRYMSPECGQGLPYNCKSDVYSFGLLCYEILTLQKPYGNLHTDAEFALDQKVAKQRVWNDGERPNLRDTWIRFPDPLSTILQSCWHDDIAERPTMAEVLSLLETTLPLLWKREGFQIKNLWRKTRSRAKSS